MKELEKGRTTEHPYGPVVHLDRGPSRREEIERRVPFVRERA